MRRLLLTILACAGAGLGSAAAAGPGDGGWRVPNGHLPPPGECRVWYPDRPAGHQPPPTDCRSARREAYRTGGRVVYGGDERGGRYDRECDEKDWRKGECGYDRREYDRYGSRGDYGTSRVVALIRNDPVLYDWARARFDANRDGRLGTREAERAILDFDRIGDRDDDGRISPREFQDARAILTRYLARR